MKASVISGLRSQKWKFITDVSGKPIGPIFRGQVSKFLNSWPLKTGSIGRPETSVMKYHYTVRNFTEERRSQIKVFLSYLLHNVGTVKGMIGCLQFDHK